MRTTKSYVAIRAALSAMLLAALVTGCARPAPAPESSPPPPVAPAVPDEPPPEETLRPSDGAPAAPAQPTPDAPPPTEPSAAPKPTAKNPNLDSMLVAIPGAKMSVAVDLRYSFDGAVSPNQPVTLHLAAVPRVAGTDLKVSLKQVDGLRLTEGPLSLRKSGDSGVYRQQVSVTKLAGAPSELRVLVTMNVGADSSFGFFSIPLDGGTNAQKQDSVKQR